MKNLIFAISLVTVVALSSCGNVGSSTSASDSLKVVNSIDTTKVMKPVNIKADSIKLIKADTVKVTIK